MYAYVNRPETLRESYWKFIINAGPLERDMLGLIKSHHRKVPALEMGPPPLRLISIGTCLTTHPRQKRKKITERQIPTPSPHHP